LHYADNHDELADEETDIQNVEKDAAQNVTSNSKKINPTKNYNENKKGLHRKRRALLQWKPMRNLAFAK
jgi:hypothetical protein